MYLGLRLRQIYLAEVSRVDLSLCYLWSLQCHCVVMPVILPFHLVQALMRRKCYRKDILNVCSGDYVKICPLSVTISGTSHLVGKLIAEFGMDNVW